MQRNGGVEQITAQRPQSRQRPLLVGSGQPAVSGDIGRQNGRKFAGLRHGSLSSEGSLAQLKMRSDIELVRHLTWIKLALVFDPNPEEFKSCEFCQPT